MLQRHIHCQRSVQHALQVSEEGGLEHGVELNVGSQPVEAFREVYGRLN